MYSIEIDNLFLFELLNIEQATHFQQHLDLKISLNKLTKFNDSLKQKKKHKNV